MLNIITHGSIGNDFRINDYHIGTRHKCSLQFALLVVEVGSLTFICVLIIHHRQGGRGCIIGCKSSMFHIVKSIERHDNGGKIQCLRMMLMKTTDYRSYSLSQIHSLASTEGYDKIAMIHLLGNLANTFDFLPAMYHIKLHSGYLH